MTPPQDVSVLLELLADSLEAVPVAGDRPLLLDDPAVAVLIAGDHHQLFCVGIEGGLPQGRREHVATCPAGLILLGGSPVGGAHEVAGLLLTGVAGSIAYRISIARLRDQAADERVRAPLARALDRLVALLSDALPPVTVPTRCRAVQPGEVIDAAEGTPLRAASGLVWVPLLELPADAPGRREASEAPVHWPVTEQRAVVGRAAGVVTSTELLLAEGEAVAVVQRFLGAAVASLATQRVEVQRQRLERDEGSYRAERRALAQSLALLAAVGRGERAAATPAVDDAFLQACRVVAEHAGASSAAVGAPRERTLGAMQGALSRMTGGRTRPVLLEGRWYEHDCGSLLGFVVGEGEELHPVALLPRGRGYELVDPRSEARPRMDRALAERLHPQAYQLYAPFPDRPLGPLDVLRHSGRGTLGDLALVGGLGTLVGAIGVAIPFLTGQIFDAVVPAGERGLLVELTVLVACIFAGQALFDIVRSFALVRAQTRMDARLEAAVWDRVLAMPLPFFRRFTAGDLAARAGGIGQIRELLAGATLAVLLSAIFSLWNLGFLFLVDLRLALAACGLVAVAGVVAVVAAQYSLRRQRTVAELDGRLGGLLLQLVSGVAKLRVTGAERRAFSVWARLFTARRQADLEAEWAHVKVAAFQAAFPLVCSAVLYWLVAAPGAARLSTGQFLAFAAAFGAFLHAVLGCVDALLSTLLVLPLYERARPVLTELIEQSGVQGERIELGGDIEVSHATFRYSADGPAILRDVSLRVGKGEFVALVGPSGSGKSTLLRLLLGFELPESGSVLYDGRPLTSLDVRIVRQQIGVVTQNSRVMAGDIFSNIVGNTGLGIDSAWRAARAAALAQDIEAMPMGMHTVISQGGGSFSGGQRQRLLIARALAPEPRILCFDEATSALDNVTQAAVSESLEGLQVTRVVIAHRLSTIQKADRIVVIDRGRVVQTGRFEELVAVEGPFRALAQRQTV